MKSIRAAIAGVGNRASSLVQGLESYKNRDEDAFAGLMHQVVWAKLLAGLIGTTAHAQAAVLAVFMGVTCLH